MRIGVDARELCGRATGAGRYLAGLLAQWHTTAQTHGHEFVLYLPDPLNVDLDARRFPTRLIPGRPGVWWEQVVMPRVASRDHLDVFFAPAYTGPLRLRIPLVVAIHDVSFVARPQWFRTREGVRRRWLTRRAVQRANAVVTISEFSRNELIERLGADAERIHVIPPGVRLPCLAPGTERAPRVLFVGSIFNRRRVPDLIRALGRLVRSHPDLSLDIVGDDRTYPHQDLAGTIEAEGLTGRVRWHKYVSDSALAALYAGARAFAFLSEYEGLGLTPLEALAAGITPVLLDTPIARESCADAALYVKGNDLKAIADALSAALFDETARARVRAAAPAVLARYNWSQAAEKTLAVLERAVRGSKDTPS